MPPLEELITKAKHLKDGLWDSLSAYSAHPQALEAKSHAMAHDDQILIAQELLSKKPAKALEELQKKYPKLGLRDVESAKSWIAKELFDANQKSLDFRNLLGRSPNVEASLTGLNVAYKSSGAAPEKEEVKKASGIVKRVVQTQRKWLEGKSDMTRSIVTNGEVFMGALMMFQGVYWVIQSLKSEQVASSIDEKDGMQLHVKKATPAYKAGHAAAGIASVAVGMGAMAVGLGSHHH